MPNTNIGSNMPGATESRSGHPHESKSAYTTARTNDGGLNNGTKKAGATIHTKGRASDTIGDTRWRYSQKEGGTQQD